MPFNAEVYATSAYMQTAQWDLNLQKYMKGPSSNPQNGNFYKPLPNDPSVTGWDPSYISSLKLPFSVSINY